MNEEDESHLARIKPMKLLTVKEVSEIISAKRTTVYEWAEMGKIPCLKINGLLRFLEEDVLAWIKDCKLDSDQYYNGPAGRRPGKEGRS